MKMNSTKVVPVDALTELKRHYESNQFPGDPFGGSDEKTQEFIDQLELIINDAYTIDVDLRDYETHIVEMKNENGEWEAVGELDSDPQFKTMRKLWKKDMRVRKEKIDE